MVQRRVKSVLSVNNTNKVKFNFGIEIPSVIRIVHPKYALPNVQAYFITFGGGMCMKWKYHFQIML